MTGRPPAPLPPGWRRLLPFPGSLPPHTAAGIDLLGAIVRRERELHLRFRLQGDLDHLLLPAAAAAPARCDLLWQHTCLEAFWGQRGEAGYWELNASPSGDWNLYRFDGYRQGQRPEPLQHPPARAWTLVPAAAGLPGRLELELRCPFPEPLAPVALEASLTAVLEHDDRHLSYWALHHPQPSPDFHHRQGFRWLL